MSNKFLSRAKEAAALNIKMAFCVTLLFTLIATALRSVLFFTCFDVEIGYFDECFAVSLLNSMIAVICLFLIGGFIYISKEANLPTEIDNSTNSIFFSATFAGFILLADFAYSFIGMLGEGGFSSFKSVFSSEYLAENLYMLRVAAIVDVLGLIASLLTAVCFFVRSARNPKAKLSAWLGFFPIIRALTGVARVYFEMEIQMNHPSKLMLQFALVSVMIYFLCEERFYISKEYARPRRFFVSGCAAFFLSFLCGVSEIIGFFSGKLSKGDFCVEAFFCLVVSFYILARTNSFVKNGKIVPCLDSTADTETVEENANE